ncbi:MAG TPA: plasmid mobilization relaxosome protein MobC [Bryobacteraceae bacterium]|nr:plasmid mobilization relaxosome protein MobC [Bryobacteraceae bacterium]
MTATETNAPVPARPSTRGKKGGRTRFLALRLDEAEYLLIGEYARNAGLSRGSFLRAAALGSPGPRAQRAPTVNAEALAHATSALNRVGNNLNQLTRIFNAGASTVTANECSAALAEVRAAAARILDIVGRKSRL